jgi:short-subunit dehydrogenase
MKRVLIVGATSAIAQAIGRRFAADGDRLFLVARNPQRLSQVAADLRARGAGMVATAVMDANELDAHGCMIAAAAAALDDIDIALVAYGTLPDQDQCQRQPEAALQTWHTNALGPMTLLAELANRFEARGAGTLAAISSVAGERGRKSNYVYGSAKAALSTYLEGLRHRLHGAGVHVLTIKPGLIDTPMTAAFRKGALWATPERVADDVYRAINRRRDVCYTPGFWAVVMLGIRCMPHWLFKRTNV